MNRFLPFGSFAFSNGEQLMVLHNVKYGVRAQAEGQSGFHVFPLWRGRHPLLAEHPRNIGSPHCEGSHQFIGIS